MQLCLIGNKLVSQFEGGSKSHIRSFRASDEKAQASVATGTWPNSCFWTGCAPCFSAPAFKDSDSLDTPNQHLGTLRNPFWRKISCSPAGEEERGHEQECAGNCCPVLGDYRMCGYHSCLGGYQDYRWWVTGQMHTSSFKCTPCSRSACSQGAFRASCPKCFHSVRYIPTHLRKLSNFRVDSVALGNVLSCIGSWFWTANTPQSVTEGNNNTTSKGQRPKERVLLMEGNFKVILNSLKSSGKSQEMGTKLALL